MIKVYIKTDCPSYDIIYHYVSNLFQEQNIEFQCLSQVPTDSSEGFWFYEVSKEENVEDINTILKQKSSLNFILLSTNKAFFVKHQHVIGFLDQNNLLESLHEITERFTKQMVLSACSFHYASSFMNFKINPIRIIFVESYHHDVYIHTTLMKLKIRDSLKNYIVNNAYVCLLQVHKSFVMNLQFIKEVNGDWIILKDGEKIPIGSRYKEQLNIEVGRVLK